MKSAATLIVAVFVVSVLGSAAPAGRVQQPDVLGWFESYRSGRIEHAVAAIRSASGGDAVESALKSDGATWILGASDGSNRRLIAGAVILEYAAAHRDRWDHVRKLLEWACKEIRTQPKSEAERVWHMAVATLAIAQGDPRFNLSQSGFGPPEWMSHAEHAAARFPDDRDLTFADAEAREQLTRVFDALFELHTPRFVDAKAAKREVEVERPAFDIRLDETTAIMYAGQPRLERRAIGQYSLRLWNIVGRWQRVEAFETVAAKAHLHAGNTLRMLAQTALALQEFAKAERAATDPTVVFLARLFAGQVLAAEGRREEAITTTRAALEVVPRAQSASFLLSSLLFDGPSRPEAIALVQDTLREPLAVDPYRSFNSWDLYTLTESLERLRRAMR